MAYALTQGMPINTIDYYRQMRFYLYRSLMRYFSTAGHNPVLGHEINLIGGNQHFGGKVNN